MQFRNLSLSCMDILIGLSQFVSRRVTDVHSLPTRWAHASQDVSLAVQCGSQSNAPFFELTCCLHLLLAGSSASISGIGGRHRPRTHKTLATASQRLRHPGRAEIGIGRKTCHRQHVFCFLTLLISHARALH